MAEAKKVRIVLTLKQAEALLRMAEDARCLYGAYYGSGAASALNVLRDTVAEAGQ